MRVMVVGCALLLAACVGPTVAPTASAPGVAPPSAPALSSGRNAASPTPNGTAASMGVRFEKTADGKLVAWVTGQPGALYRCGAVGPSGERGAPFALNSDGESGCGGDLNAGEMLFVDDDHNMRHTSDGAITAVPSPTLRPTPTPQRMVVTVTTDATGVTTARITGAKVGDPYRCGILRTNGTWAIIDRHVMFDDGTGACSVKLAPGDRTFIEDPIGQLYGVEGRTTIVMPQGTATPAPVVIATPAPAPCPAPLVVSPNSATQTTMRTVNFCLVAPSAAAAASGFDLVWQIYGPSGMGQFGQGMNAQHCEYGTTCWPMGGRVGDFHVNMGSGTYTFKLVVGSQTFTAPFVATQ